MHKIYNDTLWQDRHESDGFNGMGFVIKKILVHNEATRTRPGEAHYNMNREKWDVRTLLEVRFRHIFSPIMKSFYQCGEKSRKSVKRYQNNYVIMCL